MTAEQPRPRARPTAKREPWHPTSDYDAGDVGALQALRRGDARPDQQQKALQFIVEKIAMAHDQSFVPGQPDVTAFIEGRRSVANQINKMLGINISAVFSTTKGRNTEQP